MGLSIIHNQHRKKKVMKKKIEIDENSVYVFYNNLFNFNNYINAKTTDDAMNKFDKCEFSHRDNWKVLVELPQQRSEGPHGS